MQGKITKWFDERGFGFIQSDEISGDIFAHISQFKKGYRRPQVGDVVSFTIEHKGGKKNAKFISLNGVQPSKSRKASVTKFKILAVITIAIVGYQFLAKSGNTHSSLESNSFYQNEVTQAFESTPSYENMGFTCKGKTHCSEMRSCDEAKFYLANCPNTKMDGDGDGIPCERQHCSY